MGGLPLYGEQGSWQQRERRTQGEDEEEGEEGERGEAPARALLLLLLLLLLLQAACAQTVAVSGDAMRAATGRLHLWRQKERGRRRRKGAS